MKSKTILTYLGLVLLACGVVGYLITHAKSAIISGSATGGLMLLTSLFVEKNRGTYIFAKFLNYTFMFVFLWRLMKLSAVVNADPSKTVPFIILGIMTFSSIVAAGMLKKCGDK